VDLTSTLLISKMRPPFLPTAALVTVAAASAKTLATVLTAACGLAVNVTVNAAEPAAEVEAVGVGVAPTATETVAITTIAVVGATVAARTAASVETVVAVNAASAVVPTAAAVIAATSVAVNGLIVMGVAASADLKMSPPKITTLTLTSTSMMRSSYEDVGSLSGRGFCCSWGSIKIQAGYSIVYS